MQDRRQGIRDYLRVHGQSALRSIRTARGNIDIEKIGPKFEESPLFPEGVNVEFVKVIDKHTLKMRVWERGSGETWACGTGACAVAVAAVVNGYCDKEKEVTVKLLGGDLKIRYTDSGVFMTGDALKYTTER